MSVNIQIHEATIDQADQILAVIVAAFEQYRDELDPPSSVFRETSDNIRQKMNEGGGIIACDGEKIVGVVLYQPHTEYMYLGRLGVLPDYRGHQIARRLCEAVEDRTLAQNLNRISLNVRIGLKGNQQFFQSLGYTITEYHRHENYAEYTYVSMEKNLA